MSKLKEIRLAKGFTRKQLAELSKVSEHTINKYENGEIDIFKAAVGNMIALADALGVEVREIV